MPDFSQLTPRQLEIYNFIRDKIEERGYGPTVREIGEDFNIKSPNGVMCHLKALVKKGLIKRQDKSARAIQLVGYHAPSRGLPLVGMVAAGAPLEAIENAERLDLNSMFGTADVMALKVRGDSMIEDHINDGDIAVIKRRANAVNGERVVAMVDNEVTLKRFYDEGDRIRLEPANSELEPIVISKSEVEILGVLIGVVRKI